AVLLDRWRGSAGPIDRRWCRYFASVMSIVAGITLLGLVPSETPTASELHTSRAIGVTLIGLVGAVGTAAGSGLLFACAAVNRSRVLLHQPLEVACPLVATGTIPPVAAPRRQPHSRGFLG